MRHFTSKVKESVWKAFPRLYLLHPSEPWGKMKKILNIVKEYISIPEGLKCKTRQPFEKLLVVWYRVLKLLTAVAGVWITIWIIYKIFITRKYVKTEFGDRQVSSRMLISPLLWYSMKWELYNLLILEFSTYFRGYLARRNVFLIIFLNSSRTQSSFHGLRLSSWIKTLSITN